MKVWSLITILAVGNSQSSYEKIIQYNRKQTISILNERLSVIDNDIADVNYLIVSMNREELSKLNQTLYDDKYNLEELIYRMKE